MTSSFQEIIKVASGGINLQLFSGHNVLPREAKVGKVEHEKKEENAIFLKFLHFFPTQPFRPFRRET